MEIKIERPQKEDIEEIRTFFQTVMVDTFQKNNIPEAFEGEINAAVKRNTGTVEKDLETNGTEEYFLIARHDNQIIGIMGIGAPNKDIKKNYPIKNLDRLLEIKNAYIMPEFQGKGIGTKLFRSLVEELMKRGHKEFVLDSGFSSAQPYWKKMLGEPVVILKSYWEDGTDYMLWHVQLD